MKNKIVERGNIDTEFVLLRFSLQNKQQLMIVHMIALYSINSPVLTIESTTVH